VVGFFVFAFFLVGLNWVVLVANWLPIEIVLLKLQQYLKQLDLMLLKILWRG
jgi:hypothetical protein